MRVEKLTCNIGAELIGVDLGAASRDAGLFGEIKALLLEHKVLFLRDQDITRAEHVAFARRFGELEDHPVAGSDPEHPGPGPHLQGSRQSRPSTTRTRITAMRPGATRRRWVACCVACRRRTVGGDTIWVNMARAYADLPEHMKAQIARTARAPQHRGDVRRRHADRKAPRAQGAIPRCRASRRAHASGNGREDAVRQRLRDALQRTSTRPQNVRYGQDFAPGAAQLLSYLIGRAAIPEYQVRWRWQPNSVAIWDNRCTQHYAVQDYWPAVRKMERAGIIGEKPC